MKNLLKLFYLGAITLLLINCSKEYQIPNNLVVHDFVWKGLNAYYLHQDEIADLSDRRFNSDQQLNAYLTGFADYNTLFSSLLLSTDEKSMLIEDYTNLDLDIPRSAFVNGMEFGIISQPNTTTNTVIGYVTHILPNSNAASKNLQRGEFFNAVNNILLTEDNYFDLLINGDTSYTLNMVDFDGTTVTPNAKTVVLDKENYDYDTTFLEKTFNIGSDNIGYLMYNNNLSKSSINNLNNTFLNFKNQNINELVLDLRYNITGGSFAKNITNLATMITGQFTDEVFIKEEWNSKAQPWFLENQPDSLLTKFPAKLNPSTDFNSLNLTEVYIILNGDSFSASSAIELLINSLKPYINVHIVGTATNGNNTGSITLYNSQDYDIELKNNTHTVALQPVVLSFYNKDDQTYNEGFTPTIATCPNEDILNLGFIGERSEPILDKVLEYISTGNLGTNVTCNPNNFIYLYKSIDTQRELDNGVFIKQDLPNTY